MYNLAVFGNPIEHSLSPAIHAQFAQQLAIQASYIKILAPINSFAQAAQQFIDSGGRWF